MADSCPLSPVRAGGCDRSRVYRIYVNPYVCAGLGGKPAIPHNSESKLTVTLPAAVLRALRTRMVERETTIRALLLEALAAAGYPVPEAEIRDRRRRHAPDSVHRSRRQPAATGPR